VTDAVNVANAAYQRDGGLAGISTGLTTLIANWAACTRRTF
jgi:replicative DNA helicase